MPESLAPATPEDLRDTLRRCGDEQASIETGGAFSKCLVGGPVAEAKYRLETRNLSKLLAYEPADLTVSVEAGMRFSELDRILAENNQFLPLDPPFGSDATVGGALASNSSGPRRRRFGTARDMVIGMRFATLDGKLVSSGGMVVKNVTGLDMGKLMIGSFGTLAVIASANFKVFPMPESAASFAFKSQSVDTLLEVHREILGAALQPAAIDWLDPIASRHVGLSASHSLLVESSGSPAATRRFDDAYKSLAAKAGVELESLPQETWDQVRECGPQWLEAQPGGAVIRVSTVLSGLGGLLERSGQAGCAAVHRAGNGTGICLAPDQETARLAAESLRSHGCHATLEAASDEVKRGIVQWPASGNEIDVMQRIKADFDPLLLLNRGRLYGVI